MKKVGILTLYGYSNYGNRFQNYAVQQIVKKYGYEAETIVVYRKIRHLFLPARYAFKAATGDSKTKQFMKIYRFSKRNIPAKYYYNKSYNLPDNISEKYEFFVTGSDQVWNPLIRLKEKENFFLSFAKPDQRICISPSFGVSEVPDDLTDKYKEWLNGFKYLSSREESGVELIEKLTGRQAQLLIDPTLALDKQEWEKVFSSETYIASKYILVAFLSNISSDKYDFINRIASSNNLEIINIYDKGNEFSPEEVLRLINGASLVLTDSFHFTAFSINFKTPFVVCERDSQTVDGSTFFRLDSLLNSFGLSDRKFGIISENDALTCDFEYSGRVLEKERIKFFEYIQRCFESNA